MLQIGGLILLCIIVSIIITLTIFLLYCGYIFICRRRDPLANAENQV